MSFSDLFVENMGNVANAFASAGKGLFQWLIAFIIAIYLLGEKAKLKSGFARLLRALVGTQRYQPVSTFLKKCDSICNSYIVYNIIDSLLVGGANAIFMMLFGMQYMGLISSVVGLTNLVPTFGPMVGLVIGGFILFMVNPMHALFFIIFTLILQVVDGYILKPRLFGNSLGVSGLWILIGIIVGGNMLGIIGILLAIPSVAILDFIYKNYLIPGLEKRHQMKESETEISNS
jgi:predicted PurR-regulated permease PerM